MPSAGGAGSRGWGGQRLELGSRRGGFVWRTDRFDVGNVVAKTCCWNVVLNLFDAINKKVESSSSPIEPSVHLIRFWFD